MPKGSSSQPSGNTNPAAMAQLPFLQDAWQQAQQLYQSRPSGVGLNIANQGNDRLNTGLNTQYAIAENILDPTLRPTSQNVWMQAATGGMGNANSPATPYYQGYAQGTSAPQQEMANLTQAGLNAAKYNADTTSGWAARLGANDNLGLSQLGQTASGQYLNGNPYFSQMVQNALDPITRNYQTATAPQLDASFAGSGRYGSGAMLGQRENAQNVLADQLAKTSSNLYGQNYAQERAQQVAAAQQYGNLYNQGVAGAGALQQAAGNQFMQGITQAGELARQRLAGQEFGAQGLQSGYNTGNQAALTAMQQYPQLAQAQFIGPQQMIQSGQGVNSIQQQLLDEPYSQLTRYLNAIGGGNPQQGQSIYSNPTLEALSGISGGINLLSQGSKLLGGGGTLGGLLGSGASAALPATVGGTGAGMASALTGAAMPAAETAVSLAPAAATAGFWIVCTELVRQGRMPKRYWAVGSCTFAAYPEVGKRGYYLWGIPLVKHLRRKPQSLLSRLACRAFNWRAEDLAARSGIKGARRLLRGRMVTWLLYPICMALGTILPEQDWQQVYRDDAGSRTAG